VTFVDRQEITAPSYTISSEDWAKSFPTDDLALLLIQTVSGDIKSQSRTQKTGIPCLNHPTQFCDFFCFGCSKFVCSECAVLEHRSENCDCTTLLDIYNRRKDDVITLQLTLNRQENQLRQLITDQYRLRELFIESKSDVKCELEQHRDRLSVFYESSLRALDELSDEVDKAEFTRYNLEAQLDSFYQDISGMKRELTDVKPGVEFLANLQKIESKVDHYNSELEEMSSFLKESENSDLVRLEFIPNSLFVDILDEYSVGSIVNHSDN